MKISLCRLSPNSKSAIFLCIFLIFISVSFSQPLRVAIAGLSHDHVNNIMHQYKNGEAIIVGIAESDARLVQRYKKNFQLPDSLFYENVSSMLDHVKPDAVLAYNAIADHLSVVEACAPKMISVMVEKPLATTVVQANRIQALAKQYHIQVLTNYETTWYPSNQRVYEIVNQQQEIGGIRKMIVHMGHQGPKEIGCSPEFLNWLTDPEKNGGGALMDFGCYGANLMTWLMKGKAPVSVTAITHHIKPDIYPKVDDDATILLEYPDATGIIEASWNWPFGIKDLEVFGEKAYLHAINNNTLEERNNSKMNSVSLNSIPYPDNLSYLAAVLRGRVQPDNDLSSLENNLLVVRILEAARKSAAEGKKITL
ncbi:MAG TPA: Gfo/Idh/MocA family oxidoreductase [Puia sp.]|nr:Gfo/Idh/MocA family oxidoreductase [Puia sp.]